MARVPALATIILKFAEPVVFKSRNSKVYRKFYMQMLHLGYRKFIQINATDQKLPWMLHYIKKINRLYRQRNFVSVRVPVTNSDNRVLKILPKINTILTFYRHAN